MMYKRHTRKGKRWIVKKYFTTVKGKCWRFYCMIKDKAGELKPLYLKNASDTKIHRHVKIKSGARVFDRLHKEYFEEREQKTRTTQRHQQCY
jgi:RNA-directed DNA polymerase